MGSATCLQPGPRSAGETVSLVHGGGQQELERFLDCLRLGVPVLRPYRTKCEEGGEGLEFRGKVGGCVSHGWGCDFLPPAWPGKTPLRLLLWRGPVRLGPVPHQAIRAPFQ